MMDHIINFDWNYRDPEEYFIKPEDLDNSVTERILRNKFRDPLISSDEEGDEKRPVHIDWDEVFSKSQQNERRTRLHVPGFLIPPPHLKLSALTKQQHQQCLKIISLKYPNVLPSHYLPRPTRVDYQTYEEVKEIYEKEQQEFIEWAKGIWASDHCRRALRPKPRVETVYESWFRIKALEMQTFPKTFRLAAQIPLETLDSDVFEVIHQEELINVNIDKLPEVECPLPITEKINIMKPYAIPEPCPHHTCRFVLPTESAVTDKPLAEAHRALAAFASSHGCAGACGEGAARCLLERERAWALPVSVVDVCGADGEPCNVVVLGGEFSAVKEAAPQRTYRAFRRMLHVALVEDTEMSKLKYGNIAELRRASRESQRGGGGTAGAECGDSSDEEDAMMVIDEDDDDNAMDTSSPKAKQAKPALRKSVRLQSNRSDGRASDAPAPAPAPPPAPAGCTCAGRVFGSPPPRSYRKWRLRNKTAHDTVDVLMHCAHRLKVKGKRSELVLEPIPEYQIDLGASAQPEGKALALSLALMLRKNATVANVRVDGSSGEVVTFESYSAGAFRARHAGAGAAARVANALHTAFAQLRGLLPGTYVLRHDPSHGANAMLYAARARSGEPLALEFECARPAGDDARSVAAPPHLLPVLLPIHKHRSLLPLAFTHNPQHVAREPRKPVTRQRAPPQALQWPKKKGKKKKRQV